MENEKKKRIRLEEIYPVISEKLGEGGTVEIPITGVSMLPLLVQGRDTVTIEKGEYKKGDIIFYRRDDGHFVLHRIIGENAEGFILCGDNQWVKEYGITERHIIGRVIQIERKGKAFPVTDKKYRFYCSVWQLLLPLRRYIMYIYRHLKHS